MYNMQLHYDNQYVQRIQTDNTVGTSLFCSEVFFPKIFKLLINQSVLYVSELGTLIQLLPSFPLFSWYLCVKSVTIMLI